MVSTTAYLFFLGLLGSERILELVISGRNARRSRAQGAIEVGQRHFRSMAIFHSLFLASCAAEQLLLNRPFLGAVSWIALGGALAAQALRYWTVRTLGYRWTVRVLVIPGAQPVTSGPFRFVRHPNYLAVVTEMICVPLVHGCWLTAAIFSLGNAVLLFIRIRVEERALGPTYADAFADRPRFLPKLAGRRHGV